MLVADSLWPGLFWAVVMGIIAGHCTTTYLHRLPRGLPVLATVPYCDACHTKLATRDLFPLISFVLNRGHCRVCRAPIPPVYFALELFGALIFAVWYWQYDFGEPFIFLSTWSLALALFVAVFALHGVVGTGVTWLLLASTALFRVWGDGALMPMLEGLVIATTGVLLHWRVRGDVVSARPFASSYWLWIMAGMHFPLLVFLSLAVLALVGHMLCRWVGIGQGVQAMLFAAICLALQAAAAHIVGLQVPILP